MHINKYYLYRIHSNIYGHKDTINTNDSLFAHMMSYDLILMQ